MLDHALTDLLIGFVRSTGLEVVEAPLPGDTFLSGLSIQAGRLIVDRTRLPYPGDLLHEAGHLAVITSDARATATDAWLSNQPDLEAHAIAWSYAALVHLGLPIEVLFHAGGYQGRSAAFITTFSLGVYPGMPGLQAAGLTHASHYPAMRRWLRE